MVCCSRQRQTKHWLVSQAVRIDLYPCWENNLLEYLNIFPYSLYQFADLAIAPYGTEHIDKEREYATKMQLTHGAGGDLIEGSAAATVVTEEMRYLASRLWKNSIEQVLPFIQIMGEQVWKAAIDLKNQKGSITFNFPFGETERPNSIAWFPEVIVLKPRHALNLDSIDPVPVTETHPAVFATYELLPISKPEASRSSEGTSI